MRTNQGWGLSSLDFDSCLRPTKRMTAAKLRLLRILALQLDTDAIEQLHVALLWVFLERGNEGPRHGAGSLACDVRILSAVEQKSAHKRLHLVEATLRNCRPALA